MPQTYQDPTGGYQNIDIGTPWGSNQGAQDALGKILYLQSQTKGGGGRGGWDPQAAITELGKYADVFQNQFKQAFGHAPGSSDYDKFFSRVVAPQGTFPGGAYPDLNQLADQTRLFLSNNYNPQQEQAKGAPDQYGNVDSLFQSTLGRTATDAEKQHFGSLLSSGNLDQYSLGQFLQQLPEYTNKQDETFRNNLRGQLEQSDQKYLNNQVLPGLQSDYANAGRSFDSSGFKQAFANAAQGQNTQRDQYLAQLSASQYGNRSDQARGDYENLVQRYYGGQDFNRNQNAGLADQYRQRGFGQQDYYLQKQAYDQYLRNYGKRSGGQGIGSLAGGIIGAGTGAMSGTPWGVAAGYQAGSGIGGGIGSFF